MPPPAPLPRLAVGGLGEEFLLVYGVFGGGRKVGECVGGGRGGKEGV